MQGEEELSRGMKISPYMDRANPKVSELQETFIRGLVGSLCHSYIAAGLLPGILIEDLDTSGKLFFQLNLLLAWYQIFLKLKMN